MSLGHGRPSDNLVSCRPLILNAVSSLSPQDLETRPAAAAAAAAEQLWQLCRQSVPLPQSHATMLLLLLLLQFPSSYRFRMSATLRADAKRERTPQFSLHHEATIPTTHNNQLG